MNEYRLHGPPGCGKTTALAKSWVPDAVKRFGPDYVVICSLTKTAAQEIASRGVPIPKRNVGTLHALAYRGLGKPPLTVGKLDRWNVAQPALALSAGRPALDGQHIESVQSATLGDKLLAKLEVLRHKMTPRDEWATDVALFASRWEEWKTSECLLDFTDIIERAYHDVHLCPGAPAVMIVDECQDSSALELRLVRAWGKHTSFFILAGDGDQAIYEWRGASAEAFYGGDLPEENNYHLTQSYRVPRAVHAVASEWIATAQNRYAVDYTARDFEGSVTTSVGSSRNADQLVNDVQRDLDTGRSVMLLASCAYSLNAICARLRDQGEAFHNPYRLTNGAWNPLRGGCDRLAGLLRPAISTDEPLWSWTELHRWIELVGADPLPKGAKKRIKENAANDKANEESTGLRHEREIVELLGYDFGTAITEAMHVGPDELLKVFASHVLAGKRRLVEYGLKVAKHGVHRLLSDPTLIVGTIHSVKGGEADVVYLLPDLSTSGMKEWMTAGRSRDSVIRLFYVGMTRAREKLVLCGQAQRTSVTWPKLKD